MLAAAVEEFHRRTFWQYERRKLKERAWRRLANMLPAKLVYFVVIRAFSHATTGRYGNQIVPETLAIDVLKRWGDDHGVE